MSRSRIIVTGLRQALRLRVLPDASGEPVAELSQLHSRPEGFDAETARCFVPIERVDEFVSALLAIRAEDATERAAAGGQRRLRATPSKSPLRTAREAGEW